MQETIKNLVITGYRSYELGIFQENDPKIKVIKNVLKRELLNYLENGLEWVLLSGNLGVEIWAQEVAVELKKEYPELQIGLIFPFKDFGESWKEANQLKLTEIKESADFTAFVSQNPYQNPAQLKNHTQFLLTHSQGALLIYDDEFSGKPYWFLKDAKAFQDQNPYEIQQLTLEDLQNSFDFNDTV